MTIRDAKELGPNDFVWDYFCRGPEDSMTERVRAAHKAGFSAVGIYLGAWKKLKENPRDIEQLEETLKETNLALAK